MSSHYGHSFYGYIYAYTPKDDEKADSKSNDNETYTFEDTYFEPQEKTAFTALEFKQSNNQIMNPNNSFILNSK